VPREPRGPDYQINNHKISIHAIPYIYEKSYNGGVTFFRHTTESLRPRIHRRSGTLQLQKLVSVGRCCARQGPRPQKQVRQGVLRCCVGLCTWRLWAAGTVRQGAGSPEGSSGRNETGCGKSETGQGNCRHLNGRRYIFSAYNRVLRFATASENHAESSQRRPHRPSRNPSRPLQRGRHSEPLSGIRFARADEDGKTGVGKIFIGG
jgi:hypothetical protein